MLLTTILFSIFLGLPHLERPHYTMAQGYVESNLNKKAVGKAGEKGAWQVREKYWGKVPKSLIGQAKHSERITNELVKRNGGSLFIATVRYNGSGYQARRYAGKVLQKTFEIAVLG